METVRDFLTGNSKAIGVCVAVVVSSTIIYKLVTGRRKYKPRKCGIDYPRDTVILHQFARDRQAPSLGHFVMKLETYLRINKIKYEPDCVFKIGPKQKTPWIEYNGTAMGDSQLIIEFLEKEFGVNLNEHLTKEQRAIAWAIQKWLEEFTYWLNVHTRWVIFFDTFFDLCQSSIPRWAKGFMRKRSRALSQAVGVGRHNDEEVHAMMVNDLRRFSELLGSKNFIMCDKISDVDCAAFGVLSQVYWCTPDTCPGKQLLTGGKLQNVVDYLERIKTQYWPDWEELRKK